MKKIFCLSLICFSVLLICSCKDKNKTITGFDNSTFTGVDGGCATFFIYRFNSDQDLAIYVRGDREELGLNLSLQSFDLTNANIDVIVEQFSGSATSHYCDDAIEQDAPSVIHSWDGISGTVHLQITEDSISVSDYEVIYKLSVELENIELQDENGNTETIESVDISDIVVGWLPG